MRHHFERTAFSYAIESEVNTNHRCLSPTFMFTDLPHHRTCRSAYGGSYFGCHSRYSPIKVTYPALRKFSLVIALLNM